MLVPLIALCYFPWFTKQGVALGLIVGVIVVYLTEHWVKQHWVIF